jgi:solute carrier family 38 (sodium-coupled neutral amino acid transporter), member 11
MAEDVAPEQSEESQHLLSMTGDESEQQSKPTRPTLPSLIDTSRKHSSFAQPRRDGAPRTPNRVRFELEELRMSQQAENGTAGHPQWMDDEDYMEGDESTPTTGHESQRVPLLTEIEAPSIRVAMDFDPEEHLESARPRSNLRNAFMNMANSIM